MAKDNYPLHIEALDRELDVGAYAGHLRAVAVGWDEVGHVAHYKDVSRPRAEQHSRIGARIAAGDDERLGALTLAKTSKDTLVSAKVALLKLFEARQKLCNIRQIHPFRNGLAHRLSIASHESAGRGRVPSRWIQKCGFLRAAVPRAASLIARHLSSKPMETLVKSLLSSGAKLTDAALERLLPSPDTMPHSIHRAMRHSVFAGGKRLRPILCMEAARMVAGTGEVPDGADSLGRGVGDAPYVFADS